MLKTEKFKVSQSVFRVKVWQEKLCFKHKTFVTSLKRSIEPPSDKRACLVLSRPPIRQKSIHEDKAPVL